MAPAPLAARAALIGVIVLVQGLLLEAGMRLYGGSEAAPVFQQLFTQDPRIGHVPRPGARARFTTREFSTEIAINNVGVRGDDLGPKAPDERRILVLGDSLVLSVQVSLAQTFCQLLEAQLDARNDGWRYTVINGGVQGYGPVEEALFFDLMADGLQPDVVLIAVFVANDAIEALDSAPKLAGERPAADRVQEETMNALRRLVRRSMVLQTLRLRYDAVNASFRKAPSAQRPLLTYLAEPPPEIARGLGLARDAFARIVDRAIGMGARPAFVLLPARFQLDDGDYGRLAARVRAEGGVLDRDAATTRFAAALSPLGVPMLDLLPVLRREPDPVGLFFRGNIHFTPRGHRVVAGALAEFLEQVVPDLGPPALADSRAPGAR